MVGSISSASVWQEPHVLVFLAGSPTWMTSMHGLHGLRASLPAAGPHAEPGMAAAQPRGAMVHLQGWMSVHGTACFCRNARAMLAAG